MAATTPIETAGLNPTLALDVIRSATINNGEMISAAMTAAINGLEKLRAHALAAAAATAQSQLAAGAELTKARSPQDVLEVQSRFAQEAFEAYVSSIYTGVDVLSASLRETMRPIGKRLSAGA